MQRNGKFALLFHSLFVVFLLAPLVVVVLVAFTPNGYLSYPTSGLSLRWFKAILDNPAFIRAFWNSMYLGIAAATISAVLAIPAALAIVRYQFRGRDGLVSLFLSPLMIPHVVLGVAFLSFFSRIGIYGSFPALVAAHVIIIMPYTMRLVMASVFGMDRSAEQAALSLGSSQWTVFRRVTLPMILPGVAGGWVLAFTTSFDELSMTIFVASPSTTTLPVQMYNHIAHTIDPLIASVSTVLIVITALFMVVLDRLYGLDKVLIGKG
ncbi:ABC transporter permease [Halomonas sp. McH1-25]|uniref:ABC transporter permease n=1 Tax=unclassified Halomonas TaxID=2609666 RepID=UPI001EF53F2A|nr:MULTISPECIES: ABC transporter permease [unclassified Halomonas]MCG7601129.1 ABC transporter permease [Halomonas sp. McH1-25]MCP1344578.1 ABC transporter permease [Halomonas sp. FL8]MCP1362592.1 ABC transporter permease [Halomonas sp. BBD45]MCP1363972.1 ABC transporter permease [Halomonas sp. BBD48]